MVVKGRHLLSLPVVINKTGEVLGEVKDLIYDPINNKLLGFILEEGSWFWGTKIIPVDRVEHIREDAVTIESKDLILDSSSQSEAKDLLEKKHKITGYRLQVEDGRVIGTIQDLILDPQAGTITGYEVSSGLIDDLLEGRQDIPVPEKVILVEDSQTITYPES